MVRRSCTGSYSEVFLPSMKISPELGSISRLTILIVVVLPQPDGPSSTQISPFGTSSVTWSTAGTVLPEKVLETCSSLIIQRCSSCPKPRRGEQTLQSEQSEI